MPENEPVVLIFDVETTGLNPGRDQIIEFAFQKGLGEDAFRKSWRFRPSCAIPAAATAVHGITDEDVAECPPFSSALDTIEKIFSGSDVIVGYNVAFDVEMVAAEFKRAGRVPPDLAAKQIIDPHRLWSRCEPRRLEDAVKRFAGREHDCAHSAAADVQATGEVLAGMLKAFGLSNASWPDLDDFLDPGKKSRLGGSEHITRKDGQIVFGFGKHRGRAVLEVIKEDASYARWVLGKDFPDHVKQIVSRAAELDAQAFEAWIAVTFR
jgi:DNA polymerase-3 subunit epsilon